MSNLLFDYWPGMDLTLLGGTHTRADATPVAMQRDSADIWRQVAANVLRDGHYIGGLRHALIEQNRSNSELRSWDLTNATSWSGAATTALTAVGIDGIANHATVVSDISGAAFQNRIQNITIANDNATHAAEIWVRKDADETRFPQIGAGLTSGATPVQRRASLNTRTGAFVSANALGSGSVTVRDGGLWWVIEVTVINNTTGNTNLQIAVYPAARTVMAGSDNVAAVGSCVIGNVNVELNKTYGTSPMQTAASALTRADDQFYASYTHAPQELTVYIRGIELGTVNDFALNAAIFALGGSTDPSLFLCADAGKYTVLHVRSASVTSTTAAAPVVGDTVEFRVVLGANGSVTLGQAINGGGEAVAATSAANALAGSWLTPRIYIGDRAGAPGAFAFQAVRILKGTKTLAEMRAGQSYVRFTDSEGTAYLSNEKPFPGNRFANWTPDSSPFGQRAARQSDGAETMFRLRTDHTASFDIPGIPSRVIDGVNPAEIALRLKYHLENGGTCTVATGDAIGSVYSPCGLVPGSRPQLVLADRRAIEYTLSLQLLNLAAVPARMFTRYAEQ